MAARCNSHCFEINSDQKQARWRSTGRVKLTNRPHLLGAGRRSRSGQAAFAKSHSFSFDHRRPSCRARTAIPSAFRWPTTTTNLFPRVTPV